MIFGMLGVAMHLGGVYVCDLSVAFELQKWDDINKKSKSSPGPHGIVPQAQIQHVPPWIV